MATRNAWSLQIAVDDMATERSAHKSKYISIEVQLLPAKKSPKRKSPKVKCPCRSSKCRQNHRLFKQCQSDVSHTVKKQEANLSIPRKPHCPTSSLSAQFSAFLEDTHIGSSFYAFIPSRLGNNEAVDCAARAVTQAYQQGQVNQISADYPLPDEYIKAVRVLQRSIDISDSSLIAIMLLILFERIASDVPKNAVIHLKGLTALLQARSDACEPTEIERAVLYDSKSITHWIPLYTKSESPFESERWINLEVATCSTIIPAPIARLAQLSYQLQIRLPRLVNYVRSLKDGESNGSIDETLKLATELRSLEDVVAENEVLHRIRVEPTRDPIDKVFVPYSLKFSALEEFDAATGYWQGRILLSTLCFILSTISKFDSHEACFDKPALKSDSQRMITNLFMSIQFADSRGTFVRRRTAQALEMCMGTLSNLSEYRGIPICRVRAWLAEKISASFGKLWQANCFTTGGE